MPSLSGFSRILAGLATALWVVSIAPSAASRVAGELASPWRSHTVHGRHLVIGASAAAGAGAAELPAGALPSDARIVGAYLFWSGGGSADASVRLSQDATSVAVKADRCHVAGTRYACRADVTAHLERAGGAVVVAGIDGRQTLSPEPSGAAAWALVVVWDAASHAVERQVVIADGLTLLDETPTSAGIAELSLAGFRAIEPVEASLTVVGWDGDVDRGVPPQEDGCAACWDFVSLDEVMLQDAYGWPRNVFNSSEGPGLDIDTFDVSGVLRPGASSATLRVGSGDGLVTRVSAAHGHGEALWVGPIVWSVASGRRAVATGPVAPHAAGPVAPAATALHGPAPVAATEVGRLPLTGAAVLQAGGGLGGLGALGGLAGTSTLPSRIQASRSTIRRGEIITFTYEVRNNRLGRIARTGNGGGLIVRATVPEGFTYVPHSAVIEAPGVRAPALEPAQSTTLAFGLDGGNAGLLGVELDPAAVMRLTYQVGAGSSVRPGRTYSSSAVALLNGGASGGTPIGAEVKADVRVEGDPEFDESAVVGKVFCDHDGDGRQGGDEPGVGGVRVYADHGWYADTDATGKWHLKKLKPGNHLFKVDENTLPPGSKLTTPVKRLLLLTRGLILHANFGVTCQFESVGPQGGVRRPARAGGGAVTPVDEAPKDVPVVTVAGRLDTLSLAVDGVVQPPLRVEMTLVPPGRDGEPKSAPNTRNVVWTPANLVDPLVFDVRAWSPSDAYVSWKLQVFVVEEEGERLVRERIGTGRPPKRLTWDGTDPSGGMSVLRRGKAHHIRLTVADGRGEVATSGSAVVGASYGAKVAVIADQRLPSAGFTKALKPPASMVRSIAKLRKAISSNPGSRLLLAVHTDDTGELERDIARTKRQAYELGEAVKKALSLPEDRLLAVGYGSTRPLRPNDNERNRTVNRRVDVQLLPPDVTSQLKQPPAPAVKARVSIGGQAVTPARDGSFVKTVGRPASGRLAVRLVSAAGISRSASLWVGAPGHPVVKKAAEPEKKAAAVGEATVGKPTATLSKGDAKPLESDSLRRFGGQALRDALGTTSILLGEGPSGPGEPAITAAELKVNLPPRGVKLSTTRLFVSGTTHPDNAVSINGQAVVVSSDGRFGSSVQLPWGTSSLRIVSTDKGGHTAKIDWPLEVANTELFLLGLVDGALGQIEVTLPGGTDDTRMETGPIFLQGRGAAYVKARVSGTDLGKDLFITAHVDTAKRREFEAFYDQVIDPGRDYLIIGDASDEIQDAKARGPLYLLVELDKSKLRIGSIRTEFEGVELFRYNRSFYGAELDFDKAFAEGWDTKLQAFVTEDTEQLTRGHDELRATGGSLYYLAARDLVVGSEKVAVVVRERDTGMELARATLRRDLDYRLDYMAGRVTFQAPLPSTFDALFTIGGLQPFTARDILNGHEVWAVVDYETRQQTIGGDISFGVHGSQTFFGIVEAGGGYLQEGRADGNHYKMLGGHLKVRPKAGTLVSAEVAQALEVDGLAQVSTDGGLKYRRLSRSGDEVLGLAIKAGLDSHLGQLFDVDLNLRLTGYYQLIEAGFHSAGTTLEQGMEKFGGGATYKPTEDDTIAVRYDGATVLVPDQAFSSGFRGVARNRLTGSYGRQINRLGLMVEGGWGQHRDDADGVVYDTGSAALGASYRVTDRFELGLRQEAVFGGQDEIVGDDTMDKLRTSLTASYQLTDELALSGGQELRWNGDNATRFGIRTRLSDTSSLYFEQRMMDPENGRGRMLHSSVVGAETLTRDGSGRMYSEYRLDSGVGGRVNRAVAGVGKTFELAKGVKLALAYERTQTFGGFEGKSARDVLSTGLEILPFDGVKYGGRFEVRWDRGDEVAIGRELVQIVALNALDVKLTEDLTLMGAVNYTLTQNLTDRAVDREEFEGTAVIAYRPVKLDWVTLIARYTRLLEQETVTRTDLLTGQDTQVNVGRASHLISFAGILELPFRLQIAEKVAFKHAVEVAPDLDDARAETLLWVNRLGLHVLDQLDVAVEYRLLTALLNSDLEHGALVELAYVFFQHARLGVGYNFTSFTDDLLRSRDEDASGFYMRVTGMY